MLHQTALHRRATTTAINKMVSHSSPYQFFTTLGSPCDACPCSPRKIGSQLEDAGELGLAAELAIDGRAVLMRCPVIGPGGGRWSRYQRASAQPSASFSRSSR